MGAFTIDILQQLLARMFDAILPAQMGLQLALQLALALQQGSFKQGKLGGAQVLAHGFLLTSYWHRLWRHSLRTVKNSGSCGPGEGRMGESATLFGTGLSGPRHNEPNCIHRQRF